MNDIANPLFRGVSDAEWKEMEEMNCLWETEYRKNERICQMGNVIHELGVVTKGRVHIETVDPWGNKSKWEKAKCLRRRMRSVRNR